MSTQYPFQCVRCGFCCLNIQCPRSIEIYGKLKTCPALEFNGNVAGCALLPALGSVALGIGSGCCVKASLVKDGVEHDYAPMPERIKRLVVSGIRANKFKSVQRKEYHEQNRNP